jgi:hypothetical protein
LIVFHEIHIVSRTTVYFSPESILIDYTLILLKIDRSDIGLLLEGSVSSIPVLLKIGIIFACLSLSGNIAVSTELLIISARGLLSM